MSPAETLAGALRAHARVAHSLSVNLSTGLRCHAMDIPSGADRAASSAARRCSLPVDLAFGVRCIPPHPGDRAVACSRPVRLLVGHRTG